MNSEIQPLRLLIKALTLFVIINIVFAVVDPPFQRISAYNAIFPGRVRLPFGGVTSRYNLIVDDLDIMVASHEISVEKSSNEFRVVIIGDSSVWGESTPAQKSISVQWNQLGLTCKDKKLKFYNLAYPHPSVVKDLIILDKAMEYEPDMIVWFVTLNTLTPRRLSPFMRANSDRAAKVMNAYDIPYNSRDLRTSSEEGLYDKTLVSRRSEVARMIKLQALGFIWTFIGADGMIPSGRPLVLSNDVTRETKYKGMETKVELEPKMMFNALVAGHSIAGPLPVLVVNEPMFIATGTHSNVRYNNGYPRWAYDIYRQAMTLKAQENQWHYLDMWDAIPNQYFSDAVLHISPEGEELLIQKINPTVQEIACPGTQE